VEEGRELTESLGEHWDSPKSRKECPDCNSADLLGEEDDEDVVVRVD
jgi:hypothetical protein